jgi:mRNA-degrading endonuclease RelE of RelBE toxin-antitoxin system
LPLVIDLSDIAEKELKKMDSSVRIIFVERIKEIAINPPQSARILHLNDGIYRVDEIGNEKRLPYMIKGGVLYISHCFDNHRDYDKWWKLKLRRRR